MYSRIHCHSCVDTRNETINVIDTWLTTQYAEGRMYCCRTGRILQTSHVERMNDKVENLVDFWKYARERGIQLTFDDLCRDCPDLRDEVRARLQELSALSTDEGPAETKSHPDNPSAEKVPSQSPPIPFERSGPMGQPGRLNLTGQSWDVQPEIPGYQIERELGRGGMGVVYLATDLTLQRPVAIKLGLLSQSKTTSHNRFQNEAAALARLQHPHIVPVYAAGTIPSGQTYFVMEFVAEGTLAERVGKNPQPILDSARLVRLLARAVHVAHQRGIIHRDLKPANVLLAPLADEPALNSAWGCPKIADFGLVKILDQLSGDQAATNTGDVLGTPTFMAPEQARSGKSIGPTVDVYALGAILYSLLAGQPPFHGGTSIDIILRVLDEAPKPLRELRSEVPSALAAICHQCLEKSPDKRFPSGAALAQALEQFLLGTISTQPAKSQTHTTFPAPPPRTQTKSPLFPPPVVTPKQGTHYQIQCPLGHALQIGAEHFGQKLMCPLCEAVIHISPPRSGEPVVTKYEIQCDQGHVLRVKQKYLGKEISCPSCQQKVAMNPESSLTTSGVMLSVAKPQFFKANARPK